MITLQIEITDEQKKGLNAAIDRLFLDEKDRPSARDYALVRVNELLDGYVRQMDAEMSKQVVAALNDPAKKAAILSAAGL